MAFFAVSGMIFNNIEARGILNQRSFWCFILGFSNVQLPVLECNPYFIFFQFIGFFFSISVSCNLIGLFLCLTVGLIQQLQALKCSQQTTEKKNRQEISWQYRQRTPSGKKISSGDGRGFDLTIPKDKLEFRGRTEVSGT